MNNLPTLITRLREIQQRDGYTNFQMAEKLGCSGQLYRDTKTGSLPVGLTLLKGAVKAFPEVALDALIFLADGADISTCLAEICRDAHQKPQKSHTTSLLGRLKGFFTKQ